MLPQCGYFLPPVAQDSSFRITVVTCPGVTSIRELPRYVDSDPPAPIPNKYIDRIRRGWAPNGIDGGVEGDETLAVVDFSWEALEDVLTTAHLPVTHRDNMIQFAIEELQVRIYVAHDSVLCIQGVITCPDTTSSDELAAIAQAARMINNDYYLPKLYLGGGDGTPAVIMETSFNISCGVSSRQLREFFDFTMSSFSLAHSRMAAWV